MVVLLVKGNYPIFLVINFFVWLTARSMPWGQRTSDSSYRNLQEKYLTTVCLVKEERTTKVSEFLLILWS